MKRRTRWTSVIGVITLTVGMAACGSTEETENASEIQIDVFAGDKVPENDPIRDALQKKLGLSVKLNQAPPGPEYKTRLAGQLATGSAPDLFMVDPPSLQRFAEQNLLLDISPYLDSDLKDYSSFVDKAAMEVTKSGNGMYGVVKKPIGSYYSYWIRKDWLAKLGLQAPTNTDELFAVAQAFTEKDPDGNGKKDTYGLTGTASDGNIWRPIWAAFGSGGVGIGSGAYGAGSFYFKDGQPINGYHDPATKAALEYISKLFKAKVVDPDALTITYPQARDHAFQGKAGIAYVGWPEMTKPQFVEQIKAAQPNAEWVQLAPPAGPSGMSGLTFDVTAVPGIFAIPKSLEKDKEQLKNVLKLVNYVSTEEGNRLVCYGIEGTHYTLDNGQIKPTELLTKEGGYFYHYQLTGRDDPAYLAAKFPEQKPYYEFSLNQKLKKVYDSLVIPPTEGYNHADASRFATEQVTRFITGKAPMSEYDHFVETLTNKFGYQKFVDAGLEKLKTVKDPS